MKLLNHDSENKTNPVSFKTKADLSSLLVITIDDILNINIKDVINIR
jgi:hypothetical protein